jgi:hypothetical protein
MRLFFEHLAQIRSLGFGAMLGAGVLGLIFVMFPAFFSERIDFNNIVFLGALIGGGSHRLIDIWFVQIIFYPVGRFVSYYSRVIQLILLSKSRTISNKQKKEILKQLTEKYFIDSISNFYH